jgi:hypothetical protein
MDRREIEEILSRTRLVAPSNIFLLDEEITGETRGRFARYGGLAADETVILSVKADEEILLHEALHTSGLHWEAPTYILARILKKKLDLLPSFVKRSVHYTECSGCPVCSEFRTRGHSLKHLILR